MDTIKKQRKVLRTAFTKALTAFTTRMDSDCLSEEKIVAFQCLEMKMTELESVHSAYNQMLFQSNLEEEDIDKEIESDDSYRTHYLTAKMKISRIMNSALEAGTRTITSNTTRTPKLELPKFRGNIKDWLPF